jgi:putative membrane protein
MQSFRTNRVLQGLVAWLISFWVITAIDPLYPRDWFIENLLVFIYAAILVFTYPRFKFSNFSYGLITLFFTLHLIGAHYTYSETPFGFWLQPIFDFERNHYDRVVHFSFGLLIAYPFHEILIRCAQVKRQWSYFLAVTMVLAFSVFYELMEAVVAMIVSPELGNAYLGTQGDEWDAEKDSFLAFSGAIIAMLLTWRYLMKDSVKTR